MGFKVAVVGATGNVGREMLDILAERAFPADEVVAIASRRSQGTEVSFGDRTLKVKALDLYDFSDVDICLMSAGGEASKEWSPRIAAQGAVVIDNSSAWRYDQDVPLVVPEVNADAVRGFKKKGIIANPNCSTIQMVVSLAPIAREFGISKVVVSTYQAVSGSGRGGVEALENGREDVYPKAIAGNAIPLIGGVGEDGYTTEETKMREESRKILSLPDLPVFATAVRIPVHTGHSESVYVETDRDADLLEVLETLRSAPGVSFSGDAADFPTPLEAAGEPGTFVGRVRVEGNAISYWCVADNLLKGAATNAVQIAESLVGVRV